MPYATITDLLQVEPTITEFGVLDFDTELARSETEVNRILSVRWFAQRVKKSQLTVNSTIMDADLLDPTQWRQATVYHALAYHICPKLTVHSGGEPDKFQVMMKYYQGRFEHEMDLCLREGVRFDENNDGTISDAERQSDVSLRLKR